MVQADVSIRLANKRILYRWIESIVRSEKRELGEVLVILCSDEYLLKMNEQFLQHDYYTDIITFDYGEGKMLSGELYISIDRVRENAYTEGVEMLKELHRVIAHGVLHLCGYGDKTQKEKKEMRLKEDEKLRKLNL